MLKIVMTCFWGFHGYFL